MPSSSIASCVESISTEELREADQRKTDFLATLSHELRNPLAPIRNSIHLLEAAPPDSPKALRAKDVVRRQTEHLTRLVDDLLWLRIPDFRDVRENTHWFDVRDETGPDEFTQ